MRGKLTIAAGLIIFFLIGVWLEKEQYFSSLKRIFQSQEIPTALINYGPLGKLSKRRGFVYTVKNDYNLYPKSGKAIADLNANIFQKKRQVGKYLFRANPGRAEGFPSSEIIAKKYYQQGWPLISIAIDPEYLYDPVTGILMNITGRGRSWERMGYVSYFDQGKLLFASGVGVRAQGRTRRGLKQINSFRLYFRNEYGADQFKPGLLFGPESEPLKTLVVRKDEKFSLLISFEMVNRVGAVSPGYKAAVLFVNGEFQGMYSLTEHLKKRQWEAHIGNQNFLFKRFTSDSDQETNDRFQRLWRWANSTPGRINMYEVRKYIDLDNLCRNVISYAFCGSYDSEQNAVVLNKNIPGAKWSWINWDMDKTFTIYSSLFENAWEQYTYEMIMNNDDFFPFSRPKFQRTIDRRSRIPVEMSSRIPCLRSVLFYRLWKDDPEFHDYFYRLVMDVLNHRLNKKFLESRLKFYENLADSIAGVDFPEGYKEYTQYRPRVLREDTAKYFGAGDSFLCRVIGPKGSICSIDGYPEALDYQGWYYTDTSIKISAAEDLNFAFWKVNGQKMTSPKLSLPVTSEMEIELVTALEK